jgi:hypothetical protein
MMEEALRALILDDTAIESLVKARVDWGLRPQGKGLPAIALTVVSDSPVDHSQDGGGVNRARVQIDCFGATYGSAKATARAVRALLDGHSGGVFQGAFLAGARDLTEGENVTLIHQVALDFIVNYNL